MGLIPLADLEKFLRCPHCCSPLSREYQCTKCGAQYGMMGPWRVLVDFDNSVLNKTQFTQLKATSAIPRRNGRGWQHGAIRRAFRTQNRYAQANIGQVLAHVPLGGRVLIVGGATIGKGMQKVYDSLDIDVIGFDIYGTSHVQLIADAHQIPFQDGLFDAVIVQAVLQNVLSPKTVVAEIWRVLKPDGWVYSEMPFLQQVTEGPYDFNRLTESGHRHLFANFSIIDSGPLDGPAAQMIWSVHYLVWGITGKRTAGLIVRTLLKPMLFLDRLVKPEFRVDSTTCSFLIGQRSLHELTPHEAVDYYQGAQ